MAIPVKLQVFEGPLDLLLHLIDINKIDIYKQKMIMQNGAIIDIKEIIDINSDIFKNIKFE